MDTQHSRVYSWRRQAGWGPTFWLQVMSRLTTNRNLIWRLFLRDFSARYRQTLLGVVWAVVVPLIAVGTFLLLSRSGVLNVGAITVPYPLYALTGLAVWQVFAGGLVMCSNSLVAAGNMVVKVNFPKETLVVASFGQALVEALVRLFLLAVLCGVYRFVPPANAVWFPLTLVPLVLFTLGLGFILGLVNVVVRDVATVVVLLTNFLLLLTPVVYPVRESGPLAVLSRYNPLTVLVRVPCDLLIEGRLDEPPVFAVASALCLGFFLLAWRLFVLTEQRMTERMGTR